MSENRLTARLRALSRSCQSLESADQDRWSVTFGDGRYCLRVANDQESREKAYRLIYRLYLEREYARPHPSKMWLSIYDALPETTTLLVERNSDGGAVGALTVVFDSPMGLPADALYGAELDALRASGRRISEIVSLGVAERVENGAEILVRLFNCAYFVARGIRRSSDFIVTVNPRHAGFYERLMLFEADGPERSYDKVGGAPATLLRLNFEVAERQRSPEAPLAPRRSLYGKFLSVAEAGDTVMSLRRHLRPMSEREFGRFFVAETDILAEASPGQRAHLQACNLAFDFEALAPIPEREAI